MPFRRPDRTLRVRAGLSEPAARFFRACALTALDNGRLRSGQFELSVPILVAAGLYRSGSSYLVPTSALSDACCALRFPRACRRTSCRKAHSGCQWRRIWFSTVQYRALDCIKQWEGSELDHLCDTQIFWSMREGIANDVTGLGVAYAKRSRAELSGGC